MAKIPAFNPADVPEPENRDFSPLPSGEYPVMIIESDVKEVKPPKVGRYVELTFEVTDGEHKGRRLWERYSIENPSDDAVRIAYQDLAAIARAVGHQGQLDETTKLHFKPLTIRVELVRAGTVKRNGYRYEKDENEIRAYKPAGGQGGRGNAPAPAGSPGASTTTTSPSSPAGQQAPWLRKTG